MAPSVPPSVRSSLLPFSCVALPNASSVCGAECMYAICRIRSSSSTVPQVFDEEEGEEEEAPAQQRGF